MNENLTTTINHTIERLGISFPELLGMLFGEYDEDLFTMTNEEFIGVLNGIQ